MQKSTGKELAIWTSEICTFVDLTTSVMRTAQIYMKVDSDNAALRDEAKTKRVSHANPDLQLLTAKIRYCAEARYRIRALVAAATPGTVLLYNAGAVN
jgi:hypothetical protein